MGTGLVVFKISLQQMLSEISKEETCRLEIVPRRRGLQSALRGTALLSSGSTGAGVTQLSEERASSDRNDRVVLCDSSGPFHGCRRGQLAEHRRGWELGQTLALLSLREKVLRYGWLSGIEDNHLCPFNDRKECLRNRASLTI